MKVLIDSNFYSSLIRGTHFSSLRGSMTKQSQYIMNPGDNKETTSEYLVVTIQQDNNNENLQSYFIIEIKKKYYFSVTKNSVMEKNNYGN